MEHGRSLNYVPTWKHLISYREDGIVLIDLKHDSLQNDSYIGMGSITKKLSLK